MFPSALIVFRELIEAALIVTILLAATRGVRHRGLWMALGIAGGCAGASVVAALTLEISASFEGAGQEIVTAIILFAAVVLIGWHVVWMNSHGRQMAADMREAGRSIAEGEKHMSMLALVVGLAVLREGSEVVLMLQGFLSSGDSATVWGGALLGFGGGLLTAGLMYLGFLTLPVGRVFTTTNAILVMIAAGMAARGADFLAQAGFLPSLGNNLWDTDFLVPQQSLIGQILAALTGYIASPSGIELAFYTTTIAVIAALLWRSRHVAVVAGIALITLCILPHKANATEVLSPYVTAHEVELEQQGLITHDRNTDNSNAQAFTAALGYSPTARYRTELEGEFEREAGPDQRLQHTSFNWENTYALTEPGEYWLDTALFFENAFARTSPNDLIFGVLGATNVGKIGETFNLLLHKNYGANNTPLGFIYSNQMTYRYRAWLEPGFEIFGDTDGQPRFDNQQLAIGPGIFGKIYTVNGQALKYQLGYLFGATTASPDGAVRWKLEYEFAF